MAGKEPKVEEKPVSMAELRSGISLKTGKPIRLIVKDGKGTPRPFLPSDARDEPDAALGSSDAPDKPDAPGPEPEPEPAAPDTVRAAFDAAHFETNKAFPLKDALPTFRKVAAFANQDPSRMLVVVGHTDTVGDHASNLVLSRERARSVQAYLHDDVEVWIAEFYKHKDPGKRWGTHEDQLMLMALPFEGAPHLSGPASGATLAAAIKEFQSAAGIADPSGKMDDATRRALVLAYMKAEGTSVPEGMKSESLGASFDHLEVKTGNRRVDVFFFKNAPEPPASECRDHHESNKLPCPVYEQWRKDAKDLGDLPPPKPDQDAPTLEVIDKKGAVATFVRVGLFDEGFDETTKTAGKLQNGPTDDKSFIGRDTRSFRFRLTDAKNTGKTADITWKTVFDGGGDKGKDDDSGGSGKLTLIAQGGGVFLSNAVMVVSHPADKVEADSGLAEGPDKGQRKPGESNHRQRLIRVDNDHPLASAVAAELKPASGKPVTLQLPVFNRSPEERMRLRVHLVNVKDGSGAAAAPASRLDAASTLIQRIYASIGVFVEVQKHELDAPASCVGWPARLAGRTDPHNALAASDPSVEDGHRDAAGKVELSPPEQDLFGLLRKQSFFDAHDAYLLYVKRIFAHPLAAKGGTLDGEPGGVSFPDSILSKSASDASGMTIVASFFNDVLADMHEFTHDLANGPFGVDNLGRSTFHFFISKKTPPPGTSNDDIVNKFAAPIDCRNVMKGFFLAFNDDVFMPRRIWDTITRDGVTIPSQIDKIRTFAGGKDPKRFLRDY